PAPAPLSLMVPVQDLLLDTRTWVQAIYRHQTKPLPSEVSPPVLLVTIDQESINQADAEIDGFQTMPMDREYLAQLVTRLSELEAKVIGIDYFLTTQEPREEKLAQSIQAAVNKHNSWFVFAFNKQNNWKVSDRIASLNWSLPGDANFFPWDVELPGDETCSISCPFAYLLAVAKILNQQPPLTDIPQPQLASKFDFQQQVSSYLKKKQIPSLLSAYPPLGLRSIIDFSLPPRQAYQRIPAWEFLSQPLPNPELQQQLQEQVVIIAAGGYEDAEDSFSLPLAVGYWCDVYRRESQTVCPRNFTGGEAHAYMIHHLLSQHRLVLIPDFWLIVLAALIGKGTTLVLWEQPVKQRQQSITWLAFLTAAWGLVGLQVYLAALVAIPWFLPSVIFWTYILCSSQEKHNLMKRRFMGVHSLLLSTAIANVNLTEAVTSVESAATNKGKIIAAISKEQQKSTWERLQDIFRRRRNGGGSRGEFCSISPEKPSDKIWHTSPVFVWRGRVKRIELRHFSSNELIWSHQVTEFENSQRHALYTGTPLEPGEEYTYGLDYETIDEGKTIPDSIEPIYLKVMDAQERLSIEAELTALEGSAKALSNEELARQRAMYFAEKKLWSDAVTEIFSVSNPSLKWTQEIEELWSEVFLDSIFWCG
ncbi:MAG: CHASE2 domain-containing protein, partial [Symploca sp. SIO3E6]|nr:CHASE2 domain-containing protein [Caldora sp. SIO3E6]